MNIFKHENVWERLKNTAQKVRSKFVFYSALESLPILCHLAIDGERTICSTAVYTLSLDFSGQFSQTLFLLTALQFSYFRWRCFQKDVTLTFAEAIWRVDLDIQAVVGFNLTEKNNKKLSIIPPIYDLNSTNQYLKCFHIIRCTYTILNFGVCLVWFAIVLLVALSVTSMWKVTVSVPWPPLNPRFRQVTTRLWRVWFRTPQPDGGSGGPVRKRINL